MIDKEKIRNEIEKIVNSINPFIPDEDGKNSDYEAGKLDAATQILQLIDALQEEPSVAYVVTRCEEHSDYVEEVFFNKDKAQKYCDQFNGNENEYARHITKVEVTL